MAMQPADPVESAARSHVPGAVAAVVLAVVTAAIASRASGALATLIVVLLAALAALAVAVLAVRRSLRRLRSSVHDLEQSARAIAPGRPPARFPVRETRDGLVDLVRELNGMLERMEESSRVRREFSGNVAHEFRTSVTTILAEVQLRMLARRRGKDEHAFLERAEAELRHLGRTVESLLLLAQVDSVEPEAGPVHVDDVVRRASQRCREAAEHRAVSLEVNCPKTLPQDDPFVLGNPELLQILVENLIRNAIQHSPLGARVSIGTHRRRDVVEVSVSDSGAGIPEELKDEVFARGVHRPARAFEKGSGLGLSIASAVAQLHKGRIRLDRSDAGGCVFSVELPALDAAASK